MSRTDRLLWIDETTDRELASDGVSRYSAYLRQATHRFLDWDDQPTSNPATFAAQAFEIACAPIMSPPYVVTHQRVLTCAPHRDDDGRYALQFDVAVGMAQGIRLALPVRWRAWQMTRDGVYYAPWDNDYPAAYATITLRLPFPPLDRLPAPAYNGGEPHTPTAQYAVRVLVEHVNAALGDAFTFITTHGGGEAT
jgi:hypothetical protein